MHVNWCGNLRDKGGSCDILRMIYVVWQPECDAAMMMHVLVALIYTKCDVNLGERSRPEVGFSETAVVMAISFCGMARQPHNLPNLLHINFVMHHV
jgi:hypothetical protein